MAAFLDRRLLFVTGKGGVGKSTVAAAVALGHARRGLKTLLVELNAPERRDGLGGEAGLGPQIAKPTPEESLWAVNIRPPEALREYVLMTLKYPALYRTVFENRVVRTFIRLLPSVQELVMLGKVFYHLREKGPGGDPRFDRIVVDAPATGHALSMLSVPQVLLDTVPPGPLAHEAKIMRDLMVDPDVTAVALVSLPEELPVNETLELNAALQSRVRLRPSAVILNAFTPSRFEAGEPELLPAGSLARTLAESHRSRALRSEAAKRRLEGETGLAVVTLPRFYDGSTFVATLSQVAEKLVPAR